MVSTRVSQEVVRQAVGHLETEPVFVPPTFETPKQNFFFFFECVSEQSSLPPVSYQQCCARQRVSSLGEERRLKQTAHLVPVGQRLSGSCGQPHRHPAARGGGGGNEGTAQNISL